jgi:abortive infection bacteriophage resistance protein
MEKEFYNKPFLSYENQLSILKERGLEIQNESKALHLLEAISYYRLSGYWYPLLEEPKKNHKFKEGATFELAFKLYCFDRELRLLVIREIEKIEVAVRAKMIHILSEEKGAFWYQDSTNFSNEIKHQKTLKKIIEEYERSDEKFLKAFKSKYSNPLPPSWMMLEVASFGALSVLYGLLKPGKTRRKVARYFGVSDTVLISWLHSIVYLRNVCAHHTRLWNKAMRVQPIIPENLNVQWLSNIDIENNKCYYVLSIIITLMNRINPTHTIIERFNDLLNKYPMVDIIAMGFPYDWKKEELWQNRVSKIK